MAEPVPVNKQGPNEQSIVASGMTVEQWKKLHPGEELGPDPEDIDQVTTDPPDGSPPSDEASLEMAAYFNPTVKVEGHPNQIEAQQKLYDAAIARGDEDETTEQAGGAQGSSPGGAPGMSDLAAKRGEEGGTAALTSHAQLDKYVSDNGVTTPEDWNSKTIAGKKEWLDQNG